MRVHEQLFVKEFISLTKSDIKIFYCSQLAENYNNQNIHLPEVDNFFSQNIIMELSVTYSM